MKFASIIPPKCEHTLATAMPLTTTNLISTVIFKVMKIYVIEVMLKQLSVTVSNVINVFIYALKENLQPVKNVLHCI